MTWIGSVQILLLFVIVAAITPFLGEYMAKVFQGERVFLTPVLRPLERGIYALSGVRERREQSWVGYLVSVMFFSVAGLFITYLILRIQNHLPLNPDGQSSVGPVLAFNSAVSFTSNTNWQNYAGEATLSYLSQIAAVARSNVTSGATGIAVALVVIRGFSRHTTQLLGNFWVNVTRAILYVLLPIAVLLTVIYVAEGIPQTLGGAVTVKTLEGGSQTISRGPVASQEAVKEIGTNGAGFFNTTSAHPFENPTPLTNLLEEISALAIPFAMTWTFGRMIGNVKQGLVVAAAMALVLAVGVSLASLAEGAGNPLITSAGVSQTASETSPGGNMEGKEIRFGPVGSAVYNAVNTGSGAGSANSALDSYTPLGGMVPLVLIKLGSITPGGDGCGLYGMLIFAMIAVFVAGLMVGRTPEYLGKKIQAFEIKMAVLGLLILPVFILSFSAMTSVLPQGTSALLNTGPHGLSEILYAFGSTTANNGSAFAGLSANTNYYNIVMAVAMWLGRFLFMVPVLALAGSLAAKQRWPATAGTLRTDNLVFSGFLVGVLVLVGALTMLPALSLGPIAEHVRLVVGQLSN